MTFWPTVKVESLVRCVVWRRLSYTCTCRMYCG